MRYALRPLAEQVIVITGASSGIGLVTARRAAAAGAKVVLVARNASALSQIVNEIRDQGGDATFAVADVAVPAEVEAAACAAIEQYGRIDGWVSNAGVAIYAKLLETPFDEHERMLRTNYLGVVNSANAAIPHLRDLGGAFITVASIAAELPSPVLGAYTATKHAVKGYIESLRIELIADEIPVSVTLVKPSGINTPIGQHAANHVPGEALIPPPVYDPELVADVILDALVTPRREITVGGAGRAQVLFGEHFPALLDRMAGWLIPRLSDPTRPATEANSLFEPSNDGRERSGTEHGRAVSLYTTAVRYRKSTAMGIGVLAIAGAAYLVRRQRITAARAVS